MENGNKIKLFLVDDDPVFLKALEIEFHHHTDFTVETFVSGELCLENLSQKPDVIILDYHLDGIDTSIFVYCQLFSKYDMHLLLLRGPIQLCE